MGLGPLDLDTFAHALLGVSVDALDTIPNYDATLAGAPDRRFVSPGQPVLDCCADGQLTVNAILINDANTTPGGLAAGKRYVDGRINHVTFLVTIARCIPVADAQGNPPAVADLEAAASQTNADAWALWNHLFNVSDTLVSLCGEVFFDGMRPLAPSNCAGWTAIVRVRLDGYEETP